MEYWPMYGKNTVGKLVTFAFADPSDDQYLRYKNSPMNYSAEFCKKYFIKSKVVKSIISKSQIHACNSLYESKRVR